MVSTFNDGLVTHEYDYVEPKKEELFLSCACESEIVKLTRWENEDETYLTVYSYLADKYTFWERVKILFRGKTRSCDIVLYKDTFDKLKQF